MPPGQPAPPEKLTDVTGRTSSFTPGYRFDSRNDPFDPSRGYRLLRFLAARRKLPGRKQLLRQADPRSFTVTSRCRFRARSYLGLNLEGGYVAPFAGGEIPIFERWQIGGEQSLRGFRSGSVLPLSDEDQVFTDEARPDPGGRQVSSS